MAVALANNPMIQSPEDQFLYLRKEMEKKQEEQVRQMQELQDRAERLQRKNDQLRAQVEKSRERGRDVQDGDRAEHPIARNKGKEPVIPYNVNAPANDELSLGRSPSMSPPLGRNAQGSTRAKSRRKHSHRPAFSDVVSGASGRARREVHRKQN